MAISFEDGAIVNHLNGFCDGMGSIELNTPQ
jgi:hypothetical protein